MPINPPEHPDIRRQLKQRLLRLPPRAFELFACDLLVYIGLQNVAVTRYSGDGGIDAHGDLVATSDLVRVPTGVQVKRHRHNVQRPDIDRFIGALGGNFRHGIFITTAGYATKAREKASSSSVVSIDTVDGDQVAALMVQHSLGIQPHNMPSELDEAYFLGFEALISAHPKLVREQHETYHVEAQDDVITLKALSYALHIDMQTIRRGWVETGKLLPDITQQVGSHDIYFFRRDRIDTIRQQFIREQAPASSAEWRQTFLDYTRSRSLTKSYKPVLLKALLKLLDRNGEVRLDDLANEFLAFYIQRQHTNQPIEIGQTLLDNPALLSLEAIKRLIVKYPLDRFLIKGFLEYDADAGIVRFAPQLWSELRLYEMLDVQQNADEQLKYYYNRVR
ncbi:MAG: restriction endonuclease [Chloroflexota bacterium]|nr:restriction endonuclease [Chloroflexota bacterium]